MYRTALSATLVVAALLPTSAMAQSAAQASLSFSALTLGGFAWINTAEQASVATSAVSAADFAGWTPDAFGDLLPAYGPTAFSGMSEDGLAVPVTAASSAGTVTFAQAYTFSILQQSSLQATAMVPVAGQGNATGFARSWFTLAPGASVTFQGSLFLSVSGDNPVLPASYATADFYGYATALMATGGLLEVRETGNALLPYTPGPYAFSDIALLTLTVTNPGTETLVSFLDTGVSVYSASPIPEPGTYALMLAGIAAIGFVARRRIG